MVVGRILTERMFSFINKPPQNPVWGHCSHECFYCWAQGAKGLVEKWDMKMYRGPHTLNLKVLKRRFQKDDFIFVEDMADLFAETVLINMIGQVLNWVKVSPDAQFLFLTKNPSRYYVVLAVLSARSFDAIPPNVVLGATIESNRNYPKISKAPRQTLRLQEMLRLTKYGISNKRFISIEPIMDFDLDSFVQLIMEIKPWAVAVGYDNYRNGLPEPPLEKTMRLIAELEKFTTVYRKTLREANS